MATAKLTFYFLTGQFFVNNFPGPMSVVNFEKLMQLFVHADCRESGKAGDSPGGDWY